MTVFRVVERIDAPVARVWDLLLDWEGSAAWMVDATTVDVIGAQREGVGARVKAVTRIAGIPLTDHMEVVAWWPQRLIQVQHHRPPIKGLAWFALAPLPGNATRFEWGENLKPPFGVLGQIGGRILRAPIQSVLRSSVRKLKALAESAVPGEE